MGKEKGSSKTLSIKKNSIWSVLGSIIYALSQWGILVSIAKMGNPGMVGIFTLGLALTAPIMSLLEFNLNSVVASDRSREFEFFEYFTSRVVAIFIFLLVMFLVSIFYSDNLQISIFIIVLSFAKAIESISDIFHGQLQRYERLDLVAKSRILKGALSLGFFSIIMYLTNSLILSTFGFILSWLITLVGYDVKNVNKIDVNTVSFSFSKSQQYVLLKLTLPLGIAQLIASLNANIPRYFLEHFLGIEALGFYAAIIYIVTAGNRFIMAINAAVLPRLSENFIQGHNKKFIKLIITFCFSIVVIGLLLLVIIKKYGGDILGIIYTTEYSVFSEVFFLFVIVAIVMYLGKVLETGLTATRKFKVQPIINAMSLLVISILSYIFTPKFGIFGVGYAILVGEFCQLILRGIILSYFLQQKSIT